MLCLVTNDRCLLYMFSPAEERRHESCQLPLPTWRSGTSGSRLAFVCDYGNRITTLCSSDLRCTLQRMSECSLFSF